MTGNERLSAQISVRDQIRLDTVYDLAQIFCSVESALGTVTGSTALALLMPSPPRVPEDFDLISSAPLDRILQEIDRSGNFTPIGFFRTTIFRNGTSSTFQLTVARHDRVLLDRVDVQVATAWPSNDRIRLEIPGRSIWVYGEQLEWLAAHKLHALFKKRQSLIASSRFRDLFDLSVIGIAHLAQSEPMIRQNLRALADDLIFPMQPPAEWRAGWGKLTTAALVDYDLDECWETIREFGRKLWLDE